MLPHVLSYSEQLVQYQFTKQFSGVRHNVKYRQAAVLLRKHSWRDSHNNLKLRELIQDVALVLGIKKFQLIISLSKSLLGFDSGELCFTETLLRHRKIECNVSETERKQFTDLPV